MNVIIRATCITCGEEFQFIVDKQDYEEWRNGKPVQLAFPYLTLGEREVLISGMCGICWDSCIEE